MAQRVDCKNVISHRNNLLFNLNVYCIENITSNLMIVPGARKTLHKFTNTNTI